MTLAVLLGAPAALLLLLYGCQRRLIYFPQRYPSEYARFLPAGTVEIEARTSHGRQVAFYIPPREPRGTPPERLWIVHGGNAALALGWLEFVLAHPDPQAAFLLIDYPGYGLCEGRPSERSIGEATEALFAALATHLGASPEAVAGEIGMLGHSIGAGAGLQFTEHHRVDRLVLIAPFTSLEEMARTVVGWPLSLGVRDRFDNRVRLAALAQRSPRPSVTIIHGTGDSIVPVRMGRALAAAHPEWVQFVEVRGGDHNWIIDEAEREIVEAMLSSPEAARP